MEAMRNPDRAFVYGSTSKVTMAGAGVAFFGSSPANVEWFLKYAAKGSIGHLIGAAGARTTLPP